MRNLKVYLLDSIQGSTFSGECGTSRSDSDLWEEKNIMYGQFSTSQNMLLIEKIDWKGASSSCVWRHTQARHWNGFGSSLWLWLSFYYTLIVIYQWSYFCWMEVGEMEFHIHPHDPCTAMYVLTPGSHRSTIPPAWLSPSYSPTCSLFTGARAAEFIASEAVNHGSCIMILRGQPQQQVQQGHDFAMVQYSWNGKKQQDKVPQNRKLLCVWYAWVPTSHVCFIS